MNPDTICLEAKRVQNILQISLRTYQDTLVPVTEKMFAEERIRKRCREIAENLNRRTGKSDISSDTLEKIKEAGTRLCDELLTAEIRTTVENSKARFLQIKIDDHLVHIPWELLYIGNTFLCRKFAMGRIVDTLQPVRKNLRNMPDSPKLLILANPEGDLENAEKEGEEIGRICDTVYRKKEKSISARILSRKQVCPEAVKEKIRNFDFVHYSGHAEYDATYPDKNGWKLYQNFFTPKDISDMVGGEMPFVIFSNACQSARTAEWSENSFSTVNAFLRAGVRHYLGTFWNIADEPGSRFAQEFYRHLLSGKSIGESVKLSGDFLTEVYGPEYTGWAAYLLYGDPRTCYFHNGNPEPGVVFPDFREENESESVNPLQPRGGTVMTETVPGPARRFSPQAIVFTALILISFLIIHYTVPFRHESVPEKPNPELMKILSEQAEQKRLRIEKLYNELEEITGGPVHDGTEKNSGELSLAMVFDSEIPHGETQNLLTYAVQAQIKEKLPDVVLLHRKSLDKILEELIREKPEHFTLRFPKLLLFLEVGREKSRTFVLMQLVQKKTSEVSAVFVETLDDSELVLEQKDKIAANLIAHLQKYMEKNQGGKI